jgi:ABC-type transport system involved in multi-copper enzyme maturation permease subunit
MQPFQPSLRHILLVAGFDFAESLRSRKAIAILLLYFIAAVGGMAIFIEVLSKIRESAQADIPPEEVIKLASGLIRDAGIARQIIEIPLHSLFYGWIALTFVPLMVVLTSSDAIAGEVSSGSVRFALFRSDRFSWVLGIYLGQTLLMLVGILLGALGSHAVAAIFGHGHPFIEGLTWMLRLAGRGAFYGLAFLGLTLGLSQVTRSTGWARALSLFALIGMSIAKGVLEFKPLRSLFPALADAIKSFLPNNYWIDLWRPDFSARLMAVTVLVGLGLLYFFLGFLTFRRRDA